MAQTPSARRPVPGGAAPQASDDAAAVRALCTRERFGTLATLARDPVGHPFASAVAFALGPDGQPLLLLSGLAEHTQNLHADPRASLLVCASPTPGKPVSPLASERVTVLGDVERVGPSDIGAARDAYLQVHPEAARYLELDFVFYRLCVRSARYVGGFGRMSWLDGASLAPRDG